MFFFSFDWFMNQDFLRLRLIVMYSDIYVPHEPPGSIPRGRKRAYFFAIFQLGLVFDCRFADSFVLFLFGVLIRWQLVSFSEPDCDSLKSQKA